jgi:hypothetical protein
LVCPGLPDFSWCSIPKWEKCTKWPFIVPNGMKRMARKKYQIALHNIYQRAVNYSNIFHCKTLQNLPNLGFLVWKETIWQPWRRIEPAIPAHSQ